MPIEIREVSIHLTKEHLRSMGAGVDFTGPEFLNGVVSCTQTPTMVNVRVRDLVQPDEFQEYSYPISIVARVRVSYKQSQSQT